MDDGGIVDVDMIMLISVLLLTKDGNYEHTGRVDMLGMQ